MAHGSLVYFIVLDSCFCSYIREITFTKILDIITVSILWRIATGKQFDLSLPGLLMSYIHLMSFRCYIY